MKRKLGVNVQERFYIGETDQLKMIKDAGFDSFFTMMLREDTPEKMYGIADTAAKLGLCYETIHAPFGGANDLWEDGEDGAEFYGEMTDRIDACQSLGVPVCIMHVTVTNEAPPESELGLNRFRSLAEYAYKKNVKLAFENLEIPKHLDMVLSEIKEYHGFCWDIGHNNCYTPETDMMSLYSDRLICTHIHDNIGVTGDGITYLDDLHLLPFDGTIDWQKQMNKIKDARFDGTLMLELSKIKKQDGRYEALSMEDYLAEAFTRAQRLCEMCE